MDHCNLAVSNIVTILKAFLTTITSCHNDRNILDNQDHI